MNNNSNNGIRNDTGGVPVVDGNETKFIDRITNKFGGYTWINGGGPIMAMAVPQSRDDVGDQHRTQGKALRLVSTRENNRGGGHTIGLVVKRKTHSRQHHLSSDRTVRNKGKTRSGKATTQKSNRSCNPASDDRESNAMAESPYLRGRQAMMDALSATREAVKNYKSDNMASTSSCTNPLNTSEPSQDSETMDGGVDAHGRQGEVQQDGVVIEQTEVVRRIETGLQQSSHVMLRSSDQSASTATTASATTTTTSNKAIKSIGQVIRRVRPSHPHDDKNSVPLVHSASNSTEDKTLLDKAMAKDTKAMIVKSVPPMTNVSQVVRVPFVRGAFTAAGPMMVRDPQWMEILRTLLPDTYAAAHGSLPHNHSAAISNKWAELNPVVAAYGIVMGKNRLSSSSPPQPSSSASTVSTLSVSVSMSSKKNKVRFDDTVQTVSTLDAEKNHDETMLYNNDPPAVEISVFLDPDAVKAVEEAIRGTRAAVSDNAVIEAYGELDDQVSHLIETMALAHGSTMQLTAEALGVLQKQTFASLVTTGNDSSGGLRGERFIPCTCQGQSGGAAATAASTGMLFGRWLGLFAKALTLSVASSKGPQGDRDRATSVDSNTSLFVTESKDSDGEANPEDEAGSVASGATADTTTTASTASETNDGSNGDQSDDTSKSILETSVMVERLLGHPLRIVLSPKSRVSPDVLACLIDGLRQRAIHVEGVCSFQTSLLRSIEDRVLVPVKSFHLFHSVGDFQQAFHDGLLRENDHVFFNGASLLQTTVATTTDGVADDDSIGSITDSLPFHPYAYSKRAMKRMMRPTEKSTVELYKKTLKLNIGVYIQEQAVSAPIMDRLTKFINTNNTVYNLGMAIGGINGRASATAKGDGFWKQRYMGKPWDPNLSPVAPTSRSGVLGSLSQQVVQTLSCPGTWGHLGTVHSDWTCVEYACQDDAPVILAQCSEKR